ncbi:hypothetical protein [Aurantiacibacter marinus]|uniref:Uncharacterized protein n=1 Tax=Aurantiacibacter marinus TaxID=874156 RepID=A0A0H0XPY8_9SPHN|nr:hypothetical protein [Aurantiacibacter marinus]KLI64693.1 hypothetical protein AAV99_03920 [Aurantiacibacter marinus]
MLLYLLIAAAPLLQAEDPAPAPDCTYDLEAMLALDRQAFDQDLDGGWRPLAMRGCESEAAELIREWRHEKRDHNAILYWHEGQMRAMVGDTEQAIGLFGLTYKSPDDDADFGWNNYVDGTIAFLRQDRERLEQAIAAQMLVPAPESLMFTMPDGSTQEMSWPPNINVLRNFERCWDRPYSEAYGREGCDGPAED